MRVALASYICYKIVIANLKEHFKTELEKAGLFDKDSDYGGMVGKALMELCKTFSGQGHSVFSANWVLDLFNQLARFKTLTPISDDPKEWMKVTDGGKKDEPVWQNKRNPALFSNNGGKTYYDVDDKKRKKIKSINHKKKKEAMAGTAGEVACPAFNAVFGKLVPKP